MTVRKGLGQANILRTNNNTSTGYGVAYADEVSGHRTVANLTALYALNDWQLSASGNNTDNDAIGQLWYVVDADGNGNGCYYQLKDWSKRNEAAGWSIADYTTKAELQDKIDNIATADEEDITTEGDTPQTQVLKLKDRAYDSLNASGKGYKILRKNWQPINGERKNVLTQEMINEPNTIYEIRYDFDLNGAKIEIKENCVLNFVGGSFSNGTINLQNNIIEAPKYKIFDSGIIVKNSSSIQTAFPEWYGAKGDGVSDDFQAFNKTFDAFYTISLSNRNYVIDCSMKEKVFYIMKYIHIKGDINTIVSFKNISDNSFIFHFEKELLVENVNFTNAGKNMKGICFYHFRTYGQEDKKYWTSSSNMNLQRCNFEYFDIAVKAVSYTNRFDSCRVNHCNVGFYISGSIIDDRKLTVTNNHFIQCHVNYSTIGMHMDYCTYSIFDNCTSDENELSYDMNECDTINFISCGMEYNKKLFNMVRCTCINIIGAWMLIKREGLLTDFKKDYINLKNSDTITFKGSKFKFSSSFDNDKDDSIPQIFTIDGFYDWAKVVVLIDDSYISNYYKGLSLLFDSDSKDKVLILSNKGKYISSSRLTLPAPDASMLNVSGIEAYNLRSNQKNYFFNGLWRDSLGRTVVDVPFGVSGSRPDYLQKGDSTANTDTGFRFYDFEIRGPIYWTGTRWRDSLGVEVTKEMNLRIGTTLQRNTLSMPSDASYGYLFYDTTLGKYVVWAGREWRDMNGVNADVNKKGTSEQRPFLGIKSEGFEYYDTTLKKKILWNGTSWVNMDGSSLGE